MSLWRDRGYNFTYRNATDILDGHDYGDAIYTSSDCEDYDKYPSLHRDYIIEPGISGLDNNINDHDADKNTDDANNNFRNDSYINATYNIYVLQPPNYAYT